MILNRRTILTSGATLSAAALLPNERALAQAVVTRRSVGTMPSNHPVLVSYRRAVAAMKNLPMSDPRNWRRQAQIHNSFCPHGNWFFLPWHRAYLLAFERICRQLSNNPNFALPYWDWTANPQLPAAFANQTVGGAPNPLFNANRSSQTVVIPSSVGGATRIANLLAETSFEVFGSSRPSGQNNTNASWLRAPGLSGQFESIPHDQVHVRLGGDMRTFMSPLDPIFWLHHCNIDRLWDRWNRSGRTNSSSSLWRNFAFDGHFVTPAGSGTAAFNVAVSGLLNLNNLGYRYVVPGPPLVAAAPAAEALAGAIAPKPVDVANLPIAARIENVPTARINTPVSVPVNLQPPQTNALESIGPPVADPSGRGVAPPGNRPRASAARQAQVQRRVLVLIKDVEPPKNGNAEVRVFINHPDLKPDTPEQDRHFAGSFTFFGAPQADHAEHAEHRSKFSYLIDVTDTIRRLNIAEVDLKQLNVQLIAVPISGVSSQDFEIKPGSIEISIV